VIRLPPNHNHTTARFARSLSDAFPDIRAQCFGNPSHVLYVSKHMKPSDNSSLRLAPLRRKPVPVGGGWMRRLALVMRDLVRYVMGSRA
jgi:hypothetical protein